MGTIDILKAELLEEEKGGKEMGGGGECVVEGEKIIHRASFKELERNFLNYETLQWVLISLLLILAWGVGVILLLYTPIRRYVMRKDFQSRQLYVTSDAIVYKVMKPNLLPLLGMSKIEKYILLPLITDIVLEQGCLQSLHGLQSIRIETLGQGTQLTGHNIHICGMTNPRQFRQAVLRAVSAGRHNISLLGAAYQDSAVGSSLSQTNSHRHQTSMSRQNTMETPMQTTSHLPMLGEHVLQKVEEIKDRVKTLERLIMEKKRGYISTTPSDVPDANDQV